MYKISYEHRTARAGLAGPPSGSRESLAWLARGGWISEQAEHEPGGVLEQPGRGNGLDVSRLAMVPGLTAGTASGAGLRPVSLDTTASTGRQERLADRGAPGRGPGMSRACGLGKNRAGG
jgi:hypothetical protein